MSLYRLLPSVWLLSSRSYCDRERIDGRVVVREQRENSVILPCPFGRCPTRVTRRCSRPAWCWNAGRPAGGSRLFTININSWIRRSWRRRRRRLRVGRFFGCHAILFTTELFACVRACACACVRSGIAVALPAIATWTSSSITTAPAATTTTTAARRPKL